jgi:5-methylcytosine-specific restriction endonuclease McrA
MGPQDETREGEETAGRPSPDELDAMGEEIAQLAGQIAAATARFLQLLGDFDAVGGWGGPGVRSLAHWLSWRAGMSLRTAREHVRVARALRELPRTAEAFGRGELSFSKVRAISRVATGDTEAELVDIALNAPAAHVERLTAGLRKVLRAEAGRNGAGDGLGEEEDDDGRDDGRLGEAAPDDPPAQTLQWRWDEDSDELVVWGRFGGADGRVLLAALTRAELERVRTLAHEEAEGAAPDDEKPQDTGEVHGRIPEAGERPEAVDRTAPPPSDAGPALVALAQIGLTVQDAPAYAPSAEVIYLHEQPLGNGGSAEHPSTPAHEGVVSADGGPALDRGTGEEVQCAGSVRCVLRSRTGAVLAYGRARRLFSAGQLKALHLRDRSCRTPGCQRTRFLHAHHVVFWSRGGPTDLANAVLLCSACHRSVHLGRLAIEALGDQAFRFVDTATGKVLVGAPPVFGRADEILANRTIGPRTVTGGWEGEPLDLSLATSEILAQWKLRTDLPPGKGPHPWDDPDPRRGPEPDSYDWAAYAA